MSGLQFVCVSHDLSIYERYFSSNPYLHRHEIVLYDNTADNVAISTRYNQFIEERMVPGRWVVFAHHDMAFKEDPAVKLDKLDPGVIYGPTGSRLERGSPFLAFGPRGDGIAPFRIGRLAVYRHYGRIESNLSLCPKGAVGDEVAEPTEVDTLDCCCVIAHSDLILKRGLRFDERLDWHLYVEDFCLTARRKHGIGTQVVQWTCGHFGEGKMGEGFERCRRWFLHKHRESRFATTVNVFGGRARPADIERDYRWHTIL